MMTVPLALPLLPVETFLKYARFLGRDAVVKTERHREAKLPQHDADMFGWENAELLNRGRVDSSSVCRIIG